MRVRALAICLLALFVLVPLPVSGKESAKPPRIPSLPYKTKKRIGELFEKYFAAKEDERGAILAEVAELDPIPKSSVREFTKNLFKLAAKGRRTTGKSIRKLDHPDYPGTFIISGDSGRKRKGLFIGLHGGGEGAGDGKTAAQKWQSAQGQNCICVFPTVIKKEGSAWNKEREERYVLALIETVKRTYPIDTNRIFLAGHSMGGYGTWSIGGHNADRFAAISPNAGGIFGMRMNKETMRLADGILPNLLNTPIYFTHGADDKQVSVLPDRMAAEELAKLKKEHPTGYDYTYKEYPNIGHGLPPGGTQPLIKWLTAHKRNPYPKKVVWEPKCAWKTSFYWLALDRPAGQSVVAENKGENRFEITVTGNAGLSLMLNEEMIDFGKKVTVLLNGKVVHEDFVFHSAAALLSSIAGRNDRNMVFTARLDL